MGAVDFSDLITFTRSTGGGRFNAAGQYEWLPANQPRIDYDPVTGECRGLLIEEQRTNLLTYSGDLSQWTIVRLATAPGDGGIRLTETTEDGTHACLRFMSFSAGAAYTFSVELKSSNRYVRLLFPSAAFTSQIGAYFSLADGAVVGVVSPGVTATITPSGNGRYVCSISAVAVATASGNVDFRLSLPGFGTTYTGDGVSSVIFYRAQLEVGSFP